MSIVAHVSGVSSGGAARIAACCDVADRSVIPDRVEGGVPAIEWREVCMSEKERCRIMGAVIEVTWTGAASAQVSCPKAATPPAEFQAGCPRSAAVHLAATPRTVP
eukprot:scaffold24889_cov67-Phaeocystis_antarctica.AAC.2